MPTDAEQERQSHAASIMGRKGGSAKGARKARTPDHYRRIAKLGAAARKAQTKKKAA